MAQMAFNDPSTPMVEMNTTPLIDVMLVLLIMFIITIPMQTHSVKLDLAGDARPSAPDPVRNTVVVSEAGTIFWNGVPVSKAGLRYNLELVAEMQPSPELHLRPEPLANYALVDEVLAVTKQAGVTKMGFVGNEAYAHF